MMSLFRIPGLNLDNTFSSGLPFFELNDGTGQIRFGSGLDAGRCNCPLTEQEKQFQVVANLTKVLGNHTMKFGVIAHLKSGEKLRSAVIDDTLERLDAFVREARLILPDKSGELCIDATGGRQFIVGQ